MPKAYFKKGYDPRRKIESRPPANLRHGHKSGGLTSPTYHTWLAMKQRCLNPARHNYPLYGGRGIKICDRWLTSFENFLGDMGVRPPGMIIDRVNNDGHYTPDNCRWAYPIQSTRNRRNSIRRDYGI